MFGFVGLFFGMLVRLFRGRRSLLLENLALRQQLVALKRRRPRPSRDLFDKLFWVIARRVWSAWKQSLIIVTPETIVRWHRTGFCMYWRLISRVRRQAGRRPTPKEVRELIFRMVAENPTWGVPRIHGELRMLGFDLSERTISRWMKRAPKDPDQAKRWLAFLRNHREAIAAMDFFTVPTITFGVLYGFFVISHDRRRILHVNVTKHPRSAWIIPILGLGLSFGEPQRLALGSDASLRWVGRHGARAQVARRRHRRAFAANRDLLEHGTPTRLPAVRPKVPATGSQSIPKPRWLNLPGMLLA